MDLGGSWLAAESNEERRRAVTEAGFDDDGWTEIEVPGHWRSHPAFAASDGPILYRRTFSTAQPRPARRTFLTFNGIFYQGDVWLDGEYLGDTEGYFFPHTFEITGAVNARDDHVLTVEVACTPPVDLKAKRNLTGVFQHWDCIDPAWNPGGLWAPVAVHETGPVRIASLKVLCREATSERASLDLEAVLDTVEPASATVATAVRKEGEASDAATLVQQHALAAGTNRVKWQVVIPEPDLWWPRALGAQNLYDVEVEVRPAQRTGTDPTDTDLIGTDLIDTVSSGEASSTAVSDRRLVTTGLRQIQVRNFIATVNGERLFLKGANSGPVNRALAEGTPGELERDVSLAREAGLDLIRVHAHISRPELYDAADRQGMLIWQDLPLQWGYGQVRRQAVAQARQAVDLLGHHPSVALWCGHNEPMALDIEPGESLSAKNVVRLVRGQLLPSWNKTGLDRSIRRALERTDGSREVVAHSGILPHPAWGTDSHFYFGWYHGNERDLPGLLSRLPVVARFVSEFGAQAVPNSDEFMRPDRWPDLDWEDLENHHALQRDIFEQRVPPDRFPSFDAWRKATQDYQATVLRFHIETLRRLKYRPTGGFCMFLLADAQPAVSWSVLDHERSPKAGYWAMAEACAPVIITADRPAESYAPGEKVSFDIHAVSDLRVPLTGAVARAVLRWPGGEKAWRFAGDVPADSCTRIGRVNHAVPAGTPRGDLSLDLTLTWPEGSTKNSYLGRIS
jgi:beta-mannosidase